MKFVIFHGSFGHPQEHWFPIVKKALLDLGQEVIVPAYPCEDWDEVTKAGPAMKPTLQSLDTWFNVFDDVYKQRGFANERLCFIGQSLGPLFILHAVEKYNIQLESAIFACPFLEKIDSAWQADVVNKTFYKKDFNFSKLKKLIPMSYVLYSDNDPYVPIGHSRVFAEKMGSSIIEVKQASHINKVTCAPLIIELCKTRIGV